MNPCLFQSPAGAASTFKPAPADPTARHCVSRTISLFRRAAGSLRVVLRTHMGHTRLRALPALPLEQVYITIRIGKSQFVFLDVIHLKSVGRKLPPDNFVPLLARPIFRALASLENFEELAVNGNSVVRPFPNFPNVVVEGDFVIHGCFSFRFRDCFQPLFHALIIANFGMKFNY